MRRAERAVVLDVRGHDAADHAGRDESAAAERRDDDKKHYDTHVIPPG
jgi:hypothetical protein